ncbi:protein AGENET DOMAIN (AGD)-CONTAINING P1 [Cornus florida]|uniref:protein AGENET DOMAIN (AGD)-CONTAINING P1 n=1 Tax=Cornus florida TaxID=4283 RepID=UPI0028A2D82A|nr:protein AGENET DOMAIN (AGD)-CONTAINING P1 [Cornus florida]
MANLNAYFQKGSEVEISSNEDGFRGAWYTGTVIRPASSKTKNKILVEYKTLMADEKGSKPLRESVDVVQLRPIPPRESSRSFEFSAEVDACYNDGWWEGVITEVLANKRYSVFFRGTREQIEFGQSELRLHREWVNGKWVPPLEEEVQALKVSISTEAKSSEEMVEEEFSKGMVEEKFSKGALVEVSSDEEGFQGAWFAATVVKQIRGGKFLIEYQSLRNDDDTDFLREQVDTLHIRPYPPATSAVDHFNLLDEVDAQYNDGWWVGVISKVLNGPRYVVYFRDSNEEMEFKHTDLRLHQDWIDGKWIVASKALKL